MVYGKCKTSDFFDANLRTFDAKPPYFCPKKSDVFVFRKKNSVQNGSDRFFAAERLAYMPALVKLRMKTGR